MITAFDKNTALILIDFQKGILSRPTVTPISTVLTQAAALVEAFRQKNLPIVVVNVKPGGAWVNARKEMKPPAGMTYTPDFFEIVDEIKTQPEDIFITKQNWSAFYETALQDELQKRNVTAVVMAGVATSIGVEGTARAASERGYHVAFAIDAMTDTLAEAHENSIKNIFPRMGEVDTTANIIKWVNKINHTSFL
jgi:nicotinamidase-related amidase